MQSIVERMLKEKTCNDIPGLLCSDCPVGYLCTGDLWIDGEFAPIMLEELKKVKQQENTKKNPRTIKQALADYEEKHRKLWEECSQEIEAIMNEKE